MSSPAKRVSFLVCLAAILLVVNETQGAILLTESWESPAIAGGTTSTTLPAPWVHFSGAASSSVIVHPDATLFTQFDPLATPADGNQALRLTFTNTGVYRLSGAMIQANTIYTLQAAIGNDLFTSPRNDSWSLQLWANTNADGIFASGDTFIGQQFGTSGTAINPALGTWAINSFSFNSNDTPSLIGKELIVFLNNFDVTPQVGSSYYDDVRLSSSPVVAAVPEPASILCWCILAISGCLVGHRHAQSNNKRRSSAQGI